MDIPFWLTIAFLYFLWYMSSEPVQKLLTKYQETTVIRTFASIFKGLSNTLEKSWWSFTKFSSAVIDFFTIKRQGK